MRKVDQAKYDEKRRHILEAAEGCFQRDGFRGASIGDICATARMSPGHLYHYFDSKEAIVEGIFEMRLPREAEIVGELGLTPNADFVTAICGWLDQRMKDVRAHGTSLGLEMRAESARNPAIAKIVSRADRRVRQFLSRLLREGQKREQVDPALDPESVAAVLHSIIFGLNRLGAVRDSAFDVKAAAATLKLLIERFLRPQEIAGVKQAGHPKREENERKIPP
ncbi:MAG TPA: TetR/AcrR family transcriptional regulator [Pyrinomonadaceae bacterium]|nr:TetR/AcrR family transcriptional regulator [Pyrinomonadaceae bacterium]